MGIKHMNENDVHEQKRELSGTAPYSIVDIQPDVEGNLGLASDVGIQTCILPGRRHHAALGAKQKQ